MNGGEVKNSEYFCDTKFWSGGCGFVDIQIRGEKLEDVQWKKESARHGWNETYDR